MTSPIHQPEAAKTPATRTNPTPLRQGDRQPRPSPLVNLQGHLGNHGLRRLLQAKLEISRPDDPLEREADQVADAVMRMQDEEEELLQRTALPEEEEPLQRQADDVGGGGQLSSHLEEAIHQLHGRGNPLSEPVRSFMEPRFGADFGAVRVHSDSTAHDLARAVNAKAFTVGRDVVFGSGHYAPETEGGKHLLSHELTHVVQQGAAPTRRT